jgi:hypothetical protein
LWAHRKSSSADRHPLCQPAKDDPLYDFGEYPGQMLFLGPARSPVLHALKHSTCLK